MSGRPETREECEIVRRHRGPDISVEVVQPAPGTAGQAVGAHAERLGCAQIFPAG